MKHAQKIEFLQTDHDGPENERRDWYLIDGEEYGIVRKADGTTTLIDADGRPLSPEDVEIEDWLGMIPED